MPVECGVAASSAWREDWLFLFIRWSKASVFYGMTCILARNLKMAS
jgi:hypothetical protein